MSALVLIEHDGGRINSAVAGCVAAARQWADAAGVGVVALLCVSESEGEAAEALGKEAAHLKGIDKVMVAKGPAHGTPMAEAIANQLVSAVKAQSITGVFIAATSLGKAVMPRVAALLDVSPLSEVSRVVGKNVFERLVYAGNVVARVQSDQAVQVATVRSTSFEGLGALPADTPAAPTEVVECVSFFDASRFISKALSVSDRPELQSARVVVSGGRALGSAEQYQSVLLPLAEKLGAALGASRAAVDAGYAPNDCQVGQTGKVVAPDLYIAVGLSGAIQHLAGMKDSKVIVAINKDPDAPIFQVADYGLVGDLFELVPELTRQL